LSVLKKTSDF